MEHLNKPAQLLFPNQLQVMLFILRQNNSTPQD